MGGLHLSLGGVERRRAFALGLASSLSHAAVAAAIAAEALPSLLDLRLVDGRTHELLRAADVALTKPGTVTLEAALLGTPQVVAARVPAASAFAMRRIVKVAYWAMPSLIVGAPVVPELLQDDAQPAPLAAALRSLLAGSARSAQLAALARVREALGPGGAAGRTAEIARQLLEEPGQ